MVGLFELESFTDSNTIDHVPVYINLKIEEKNFVETEVPYSETQVG